MPFDRSIRPLARCFQCTRSQSVPPSIRALSSTSSFQVEPESRTLQAESLPPPSTPSTATSQKPRNPYAVSTAHSEGQLLRNQKLMPIGSRRRRAAIQSTSNIPFAELPYQCFQEARTYLQEDRKEKLELIRVQRERIQRLTEASVAPQDEEPRQRRLRSMRTRLEELKVLADINDPMVKKKFEDGRGDMSKPIYRYLADRRWRSYKRPLLMQRIEQMHLVPDVLPGLDPVISTTLSFRGRKVQHGEYVDSRVSELAPKLDIQCYDKGPRLLTIAVINADVPDVSKDGFDYRCHFLASNIEISPTETRVQLGKLEETSQLILPWLPAYAQRGAPYQRMGIFIFQQPAGSPPLDVAQIKSAGRYTKREGFNLRSFADRHMLKPVGVDLFRTKWDEGTAGVMQRAAVVGWDVEFRRKRVEPLPYQRKESERYR